MADADIHDRDGAERATNEEEKPVTNEEEKPVTNEEEKPVANEEEKPVANEEEKPVTNEEERRVKESELKEEVAAGNTKLRQQVNRFQDVILQVLLFKKRLDDGDPGYEDLNRLRNEISQSFIETIELLKRLDALKAGRVRVESRLEKRERYERFPEIMRSFVAGHSTWTSPEESGRWLEGLDADEKGTLARFGFWTEEEDAGHHLDWITDPKEKAGEILERMCHALKGWGKANLELSSVGS